MGLNLQAANVVINLDLPWNPARLEQRIARAWRKHQTRPVRVLYLVAEDTIEHRMIPLLAGKQTLADGVLDGRGDLSEMPLPSGRKALIERLETLTGLTAALHPEPDQPAADPWEPLGGELRTELGDRLLRLETRPGRDGREVLFLVAEGAVERPRIEEILSRHFDATASPPVLELLDRPAFEALERLVEAGVLSFAAEGRRVLHSAPAPGPERDAATRPPARRRPRDLSRRPSGRSAWPPSSPEEDFPSRPCPPSAKASSSPSRPAREMEGLDLPDDLPVPVSWIVERLPTALPLLDRLRAEPGALLGATEDEARTWIAGGETLAAEIESSLMQSVGTGSGPLARVN